MLSCRLFVVFAMLIATTKAGAQHGGSAPPNRTPPPEASQFNFLIGQWELDVKPAPASLGQRIHGMPKLVGVWKGWRVLDGWGISDEMRVTDASGNPVGLSHVIRFYDASTKTWKTSSIDANRGVFTAGVGRSTSGEMTTTSRGTDAEGKAYVSRTRYQDITRDTFRFVQERSFDNGKTWKRNLEIEAKRVSAAASR